MVTLVFILLIALLIAVFALKNSALIVVDLFLTKVQMSQAVLIIASAALGALVVMVLYLVHRFKSGRKIKALTKELEATKMSMEKTELRLAECESELRTKTKKTLEQSINDGRVKGFETDTDKFGKTTENQSYDGRPGSIDDGNKIEGRIE